MDQRRVILTVVTVGLVSAAIWAWHERPDRTEAAPAPRQAFAPAQEAQLPPPVQSAPSDPALAVPPPTQAEPASAAGAPEVDQSSVSAHVDPPSVDTPEPAQQKFARGARAEPDQN
jgi:hypothetical protein